MKRNPTFSILRIVALLLLLAGAVGSVVAVFNAGRNNSSVLLRAFFVIWVLSPFIGFMLANRTSVRWQLSARTMLYILMIIVAVGSLLVYNGVFGAIGPKPAFIFLVAPLLSWIAMVILIALAARRSRKNGNSW